MNTPETDTQTEGGRAASSLATCSEVSTHWILEGQRKRNPAIWDAIGGGNFDSETEAREEEKGYRDYMESGDSGWMDFRVVQVTSTREILPNNSDDTRGK